MRVGRSKFRIVLKYSPAFPPKVFIRIWVGGQEDRRPGACRPACSRAARRPQRCSRTSPGPCMLRGARSPLPHTGGGITYLGRKSVLADFLLRKSERKTGILLTCLEWGFQMSMGYCRHYRGGGNWLELAGLVPSWRDNLWGSITGPAHGRKTQHGFGPVPSLQVNL